MKARIIKTGEEITIIGISKEWGTAQYYGSDRIYRQRTFRDEEIELLETAESPIDWEQRRYELAKEAMNGYLYSTVIVGINPNPSFKDIATFSVRLADALIKELKGGEQ